jgi:RNA polymerase sigma-B factor
MQSMPQRLRQRNRRVQENLPMVRRIAAHYAACTAEPYDDLLQVGAMGLIRAAELYSRHRQVPFSAFAAPHVRGSVLHYLRDVVPLVRVSRRLQERCQEVERCRQTIWTEEARMASSLELQARLGLNPRQWQELQVVANLARRQPLDALAECDHQTEELPIGSTDGPDPMAALQSLEPKLRQVIEAVVLKGASLRMVAAEQGSSASTVHRLLHRALKALRIQLSPASDAPAC